MLKIIVGFLFYAGFILSCDCAKATDFVSQQLQDELNSIPGKEGNEIRYGFDILNNTATYFGPKGRLGKYTKSRVSCSQCHLEAGTRVFGNSFLDTHGLYPQYRNREGKVQTLSERINACFQHPLLGIKPIPPESREMNALMMYFRWLGRSRKIPEKDNDDRLLTVEFLDRAANPQAGKIIFAARCASCHGDEGKGLLDVSKKFYIYPPLQGEESFMNGSSMSRLSVLTRFLKYNMPYEIKPPIKPVLSNDEAWDIAAFVLTLKRPSWKGKIPFPSLIEKPFDYPIGPYDDSFSSEQHRLGPYKPILDYIQNARGMWPLERTGI